MRDKILELLKERLFQGIVGFHELPERERAEIRDILAELVNIDNLDPNSFSEYAKWRPVIKGRSIALCTRYGIHQASEKVVDAYRKYFAVSEDKVYMAQDGEKVERLLGELKKDLDSFLADDISKMRASVEDILDLMSHIDLDRAYEYARKILMNQKTDAIEIEAIVKVYHLKFGGELSRPLAEDIGADTDRALKVLPILKKRDVNKNIIKRFIACFDEELQSKLKTLLGKSWLE
jgi:hypothetical protein